MNRPAISIIIPTFNEEERLGKLLNLLKQNAGDEISEIIIADGGSSDQTCTIAENQGVKVVSCPQRGRAVQMNVGAEKATGTILYFLHADTTPPPNFCALITEALQKGYSCGCFQLRFDDHHPALRLYGWCTRFSFTVFRFGDQSLFVEKSLFQKVGGFDESLKVMEDQEIVRELKRIGRFTIMKESVLTSARRYKRNGEIRLQMIFALIVILYYLGVKQDRLVNIYQRFVRP